MGLHSIEHQAIDVDAAAVTANGTARTYSQIPLRLCAELLIANIGGGGTWSVAFDGSRDGGTTWVELFVGTAQAANGRYTEAVPVERLRHLTYRVRAVRGGAATGDLDVWQQAVLEQPR